MKEDVAKLRTFAIISHGGAGKTSLAKPCCLNAGVTTRLGKVDEGTSVMDYEPEEVKRKITISTAFNTLNWKKHQLTSSTPPEISTSLLRPGLPCRGPTQSLS